MIVCSDQSVKVQQASMRVGMHQRSDGSKIAKLIKFNLRAFGNYGNPYFKQCEKIMLFKFIDSQYRCYLHLFWEFPSFFADYQLSYLFLHHQTSNGVADSPQININSNFFTQLKALVYDQGILLFLRWSNRLRIPHTLSSQNSYLSEKPFNFILTIYKKKKIYNKLSVSMNRRKTIPCWNGPTCPYHALGGCWFIHKYSDKRFSDDNSDRIVGSIRQDMSERERLQLAQALKESRQLAESLLEYQNVRKREIARQNRKNLIIEGKQIPTIRVLNTSIQNCLSAQCFKKSHHFAFYKGCSIIDCSICLETNEIGVLMTYLFCKHVFHKQCIEKWLKKNNYCPLCKQDFRQHLQYKEDPDFQKSQEGKLSKQLKFAEDKQR